MQTLCHSCTLSACWYTVCRALAHGREYISSRPRQSRGRGGCGVSGPLGFVRYIAGLLRVTPDAYVFAVRPLLSHRPSSIPSLPPAGALLRQTGDQLRRISAILQATVNQRRRRRRRDDRRRLDFAELVNEEHFEHKQLRHRISQRSGDNRETQFLYRRLSVIMQRYNAVLYGESFLAASDDPDM